MHKSIVPGVLAVLLLVPVTGTAQVATGLRAGYRSAGLTTSQGTGTLEEPVFGGYLGFGVSDRLALQLEVVYGTRGASGLGLGDGVLSDTAGDVTVAMQYVEVPMLLRVGIPGDRFLISFFSGPYAGFNTSCDVRSGGGATTCADTAAAQRFEPRATDFGLVAGGGLDVAFGESTFFIDARYSLGLLSIQGGSEPFDARHYGAGVTAGFAVPLGQ